MIADTCLPLLLCISLAVVTSGQNFGDGSSASIPQSLGDSGNAVQPQLFANSFNPGNPQASPVGNSFQPGPSSTIRETRIITNVVREVPVQRTVPIRSHVLPIDPLARQPLVQSSVLPQPPPTRRRSRGRRPVPSSPILPQESTINPCEQVKESGPCFDVFLKWAYNPSSGKCHEFIYGGCNGNGNQFATAQECMNTCGTTQYQTLGLTPINPVVTVVA